ncbi:hypothetical protein CEXT_264121 [Caerostris extrusa]|uniref:Uncharacterized protein n=1 Tax=Caerostris extrusa TaxID=172846 RepID=A0AAV4PAZ0_CAEEX|nr:hypothetical protein CEXT_264121 [Caerostris extrusa]
MHSIFLATYSSAHHRNEFHLVREGRSTNKRSRSRPSFYLYQHFHLRLSIPFPRVHGVVPLFITIKDIKGRGLSGGWSTGTVGSFGGGGASKSGKWEINFDFLFPFLSGDLGIESRGRGWKLYIEM